MQDPTNVVGRRVGAFIIDLILLSIVNFAVFFAMAEKVSDILRKGDVDLDTTLYGNVTIGDDEYALYGGRWVAYVLIMLGVWFLYWVVLQGTTGWTPGKRLVGIRTVDENGQYPGLLKAFVRQIVWIVDAFPWFIPYLTGFILALTTKGHRRLGDMLAKTFVIQADAVGRLPTALGYAGGDGVAPRAASVGAPSRRSCSGRCNSSRSTLRRSRRPSPPRRSSSPPAGTPTRTSRRVCATGTGRRWTSNTAD